MNSLKEFQFFAPIKEWQSRKSDVNFCFCFGVITKCRPKVFGKNRGSQLTDTQCKAKNAPTSKMIPSATGRK